jgi:glucose-6-phosphate dehydrogenase assembly protein OpcA
MEQTTLQRATALDPLDIEKTLTALWKEYAATTPPGGVVGARARLANLVSYCRSKPETESAMAEIAELNSVRPVRSILVSTQTGRSAKEAEAAIKCGTAHAKPVCYEEVLLRLSEDAVQLLPSVVEPLTIPDLPVYLWFPGDPQLDDPQVDRLLTLTDRVVTDSHHFARPANQFRRLHHWMEYFRGEIVFTEMTWARLGTWREAVGKLFDATENRALLPGIREVVVTSVHGAGEPSDRAMLMTGWLASKLGWRPERLERGHPSRAVYTSDTGPVSVTWKEGPASSRGHLLGLEMHAEDVVFHVNRLKNDPSGAIRSGVTRKGKAEPGPAYNPIHYSIHELLCNALEIRAPYKDWEEALAAVAGLKEEA